jgi:hypothetical protein
MARFEVLDMLFLPARIATGFTDRGFIASLESDTGDN